MKFPVVALLSDFGGQDGFVGVMKGVLLSRLDMPGVPIVDISHEIPPQDIGFGMWILDNAYPYFPPETLFVCVVDPGVGNPDQAMLLCAWPERRQFFIAPDNGLLTPIWEAAGEALIAYDIRNAAVFREARLSPLGRSQTFHGRDVYAPMAALLANALLAGEQAAFLETLGPPLARIKLIERPVASREIQDGLIVIRGTIVARDTFGNLISNVPNAWVPPDNQLAFDFGGGTSGQTQNETLICPLVQTYAQSPAPISSEAPWPLVTVPSSGKTLELAVFQGSAAQRLPHVRVGMAFRLTVSPPGY